jgi:hypothetical protein
MALRFSSLSDAQLGEMLTSLVQQIASGVASVSINGITTTYSTPGNIRTAIDEIEAELADRALASAKLPRRAAMVMQYPSMGGKGY